MSRWHPSENDSAETQVIEIVLEAAGGGVVLPVQGQPKARKNGVVGVHNGRLKVAVTQAPEKGKANSAILEVLARDLGLRKSQFELLSGDTSPQKSVLVRGVTPDELHAAIQACLGAG